ncbi:DNA-binding GntR family transcriptional regulator [Azospirillum rugosum]|uniref:DNA-binding GntR family transcriptional regulator n=1 Tax=Azospirillum rugosum TaxID=416170 RepID=A0ABS4SXN3_9PROT|nr:GntR family transcriptional regulator [Azospirillum rugosum]MBP2297300.1 DNA-binding GntR family transcriptional regulator [Azospirillum rugosum]MDQ0531142.1 DNA-binding GntR family transcriptional regulator [Azospirillum rugosum]
MKKAAQSTAVPAAIPGSPVAEPVAERNPAPAAPTRSRRRATAATARPVQRGTTVAATIYRDLRNEIVSLRRKPGEPIAEKLIAQDYGVSRTPVREAVLRLADEGLIEIFPQSGTFVARIPLGALPEAIAIRKALEEATVRYAAQRATRSQVAKLRANLELQRELEAAGDFNGFHQADESFHALIAETAGYPGFWALTQQVKVQVDRFRLLTLPVLGRVPAVIAEHTTIVEAIANHDPDAAAKALDVHLDYLQVTISDAQKANPLYFTAPLDDKAPA